MLHVVPAIQQAERGDLGPQVRVLTARDLVIVDLGRAALEAALERRVGLAHGLPVVGQRLHDLVGQTGLLRVTAQRRDQCVHARL